VAFARYPSAQQLSLSSLDFAIGMLARRGRTAVSSSLSYGLVVHLLLLPTTHHCVAVAFSYRPESVYLERTFTSLTIALSGAHPAHGSGRKLQVLTIHSKSGWERLVSCRMNSADLNDPPTAVGGIPKSIRV